MKDKGLVIKDALENAAALAVFILGFALLLGVTIGLDVLYNTKVLHQPAKCAFTKCVTVIDVQETK